MYKHMRVVVLTVFQKTERIRHNVLLEGLQTSQNTDMSHGDGDQLMKDKKKR